MTTLDVTFDGNIPAESGGKRATEVMVEPGESGDSRGVEERHIVLCLDISGSMRWQVDPSTSEETSKLEKVKQGAQSALEDQLEDSDYVSVVTFSGDAETVVPIENWGETNEGLFWETVEELESGGKTDIYGALEHAHEELRKAGSRDAVRRILLLTDGQHNPGGDTSTDPDFEALAADIEESEVSIMAAGVGSDYDRHLMKTLADASQGNWHHLETEDDFVGFVENELDRMSEVGAVAPKLEIELHSPFLAEDFYRRVGDQSQPGNERWTDDGSTAVIPLGDLVGGESQIVTFDLGTPPRPEFVGEERTAADIRLRQDGRTVEETTIEAEFIGIPEDTGSEGDDDEHAIPVDRSRVHTRNKFEDRIDSAETEAEFDEIEEELEDEVRDDYPELFEELLERLEAAREDDRGLLAEPTAPPADTDDD